ASGCRSPPTPPPLPYTTLFRSDPQTARILRSVRWQVEHFTEIPVLVVACLRGGSKLPYLPSPAVAASSHYGSIYPSVQNLLLARSEEHTSELQSRENLVCRLLL